MVKAILSSLLFILLFTSCTTVKHISRPGNTAGIQLDTFRLYDSSRQREIPVASYHTSNITKGIVVFNHGYGANYAKNYLVYSYLTRFFASEGYFVISIQHELKTDSLLPTEGIPQVVRLPFWTRGVENIAFTLSELKKSHPTLNFDHITLVGHSNGGDMIALYPTIHSNQVERIITLDHLRVPLPKEKGLSVLSLRSSDKEADPGVIPSKEAQRKFDCSIIQLKNINHNGMNDFGRKHQKKLILSHIDSFLLNE